MIYVGIVGSEASKFTPETEAEAKATIRAIAFATALEHGQEVTLVSGECHLGGIDIWVKEAAEALHLGYIGYPPAKRAWEGGYKQRNIQIAKRSDVVYCITVKALPENYKGMRFPKCYHCNTNDHIKSGGCYTVNYAKKLGKEGEVIVIEQTEPHGD